jgi:hypothetical protein
MIESYKTKRKTSEWRTKVQMATTGEERVMQKEGRISSSLKLRRLLNDCIIV